MVRRKRTDDELEAQKQAGAWLRHTRNRLDLRQMDVAKALGLKYYTAISQIESGKIKLSSVHFEALARLFGITPRAFARKMLVYYNSHTFRALFGEPTANDLSVFEELEGKE